MRFGMVPLLMAAIAIIAPNSYAVAATKRPTPKVNMSVDDMVKARTKEYCSSHTSAYCSEFITEITEARGACEEYKSNAAGIYFSVGIGQPPNVILRGLLSAYEPSTVDLDRRSLLSVDDLRGLIQSALAAQSKETEPEFVESSYRYCLKRTGISRAP